MDYLKLKSLVLTAGLLLLCGCNDNSQSKAAENADLKSVIHTEKIAVKNNSAKTTPVSNQSAAKTRKVILKRAPVITRNNSPVKLYIDGIEAFPAMEKRIKSARKSLYIEIFIFHYDETGKRIAGEIIKKQEQGVDVKVIIDSVGLKFAKDDYKIVDLLKSKGVDVRVFNQEFISGTGLNITHRKIILADGERVIIGGMNFGKEYENEWHDSMAEMHGEIATEIQKEFLTEWKRVGGKIPAQVPVLKPGKKYGNTPIQLVVTNVTPDDTNHELHYSMIGVIDRAKKTVRIQAPYFSDDEMIASIIRAGKRGVNVDIIMPQHNNHSVFKDLNLGNAKKFLEESKNINVYFYKPVFSHLKAIIADNTAMIGSANLDERSFTGNQELCTIIEDPALINDLNKRLFKVDIEKSEKATLANIKVSPVKNAMINTLELVDYYF